MSLHDVALILLVFGSIVANAEDWIRVGDDAHPFCEKRSCVVSQGKSKVEVKMNTEVKDDLVYLRSLELKNRLSGKTQTFETSEVNASESRRPFELFRVHLQRPEVTDLALFAFNSAKAGPSYYYFLYDAKKGVFVVSDSTAPKLVWDEKTKTLKTEVQEVAFEIRDHKVTEK